ncbi:GNAT family N-acetyltransferase [Terriglobus saanensis]|uniref:GCN5-related N-acetyltransferase n=1 Tax=Terriglobus saanensis (strain ATCC BAA-1853 / DSM 23119 / SP1PR4) TaxID=401053 RepID=E8UZT4_TERSS|nr:GNAT family N-acetyltransferase [Terriglobus saanensis]ADV81011.1 GCN5-related N-acetyltransferase [Terriglobus saanensis SP1PR4]
MATATPVRVTSLYLRQAESADEEFLQRLYAEQRTAELESSGLDALQCEVFLQIQFRARQLSYAAHYPTASDQIIHLECGSPIGRILVERSTEGMRLIDIALLRKQQRRGFGTKLLHALLQECMSRGEELRLQVLKGSVAERLYLRLGFVLTGEDPFRKQMVWTGGSQETSHGRITKRALC